MKDIASQDVSVCNSKRTHALEAIRGRVESSGVSPNGHTRMGSSMHLGPESTPNVNVNYGALMHGQAQGQLKPFSILKPGGAWLQRRATVVHQWGSSKMPTASFDPILTSFLAQGP